MEEQDGVLCFSRSGHVGEGRLEALLLKSCNHDWPEKELQSLALKSEANYYEYQSFVALACDGLFVQPQPLATALPIYIRDFMKHFLEKKSIESSYSIQSKCSGSFKT